MRYAHSFVACLSIGSTLACGNGNPFVADAGDGGITFNDGGSQASCSSDLHQIVDASGNVLTTCPPDQGCAGGKCVPACQAAAAAHGSVGCDFVVATPSFFADVYPQYYSPCLAIFIANNWGADTTLTVSRAGTSYDPTKFGRISATGVAPSSWAAVPATGIPQGTVGVLFMESDPSSNFKCPAGPALLQGTAVQGTGRGQAWHVTTNFPVSAYDILPFGGAGSFLPGATLLFPTTAWGTNYIAAEPKLGSGSLAITGGPHWGQIVAMQDKTSVDIVPTAALPSGTNVVAAPVNVKTTYTLDAGEFIQWQPGYTWKATPAEAVPMDMSGSIISSNNPVAFIGGNGNMCLGSATSTGGGCDSDHEQIPPISALGSEYAVVPYEPRGGLVESVIYRFTGAVDGTTLAYDPPVTVAPTTLKLGQMAEFESTQEFVVRSQDAQHPFHVALMMTGGDLTNGLKAFGDEDYVQLLAPAQFLSSYVFYSDVTYGTTNFTVVRNKTSRGFEDVTIDCVGTVTGWKPVDTADTYEYAWVDILKGGVAQHNNCRNGPHTASSKGPFGLTVWGEDDYASYGYSAGGNLSAINTVVVPAQPH